MVLLLLNFSVRLQGTRFYLVLFSISWYAGHDGSFSMVTRVATGAWAGISGARSLWWTVWTVLNHCQTLYTSTHHLGLVDHHHGRFVLVEAARDALAASSTDTGTAATAHAHDCDHSKDDENWNANYQCHFHRFLNKVVFNTFHLYY